MTVISDEFDNPLGEYPYYRTEDIDVLTDLQNRSHVDIRQGRPDEGWTIGTFGPDPALNNRYALHVDVPGGGTAITTSVMEDIDLSQILDYDLSLSMPGIPVGSLSLPSCFLRFKKGTDSISFPFELWSYGALAAAYPTYSDIESAFTSYGMLYGKGLLYGTTEARWSVSDLGTLTTFDTVELEFAANAPCTVTVSALRALSPSWTPTTLDINTRSHRLEPTVDRNGVISTTPFPHLWRTSEVPGQDDPLPVNAKLGVDFYTGSLTHDNSITVYLRGRREDFLTQLDLDAADDNSDGILETVTMDDIDNYGTQPDYGRAMYNPVPQSDFETMTQTELDLFTQSHMERAFDTIAESWIQIQIRFGITNNDVILSTTEMGTAKTVGTGIPFVANTEYLIMTDAVDDYVRVRIFPINTDGSVDRTTLIFDSNEIHDDFTFKRRKGRVGWKVDLQDGDSYVGSIRSRGMLYGEWLSQNFESLTPVDGARVFVGATPDVDTPLASLPYGAATITFDTFTKRSSDGSAKVVAATNDGLISRPVVFEDFLNSSILFDIFYPKTALDAGSFPELYLQNEKGFLVRLGMPGLIGDTWQSVEVRPLLASLQQTGPWSVLIKQDTGTSTFWVDNFTYRQKSVRWDGRSTFNNPWGRNRDDWTDFGSLINSDKNGVLFPDRGSFLQIRGQSLAQHATIDKLYIKPKYAELGRLVWNVDRRYRTPNPGDTY